MFGKKKSPATSASAPSDQYRMKSTGERVTLIQNLSSGDVRIAKDSGRVLREDIVSRSDITPA